MKKFLITLLIFIICHAGAYAEKLKAVALNEFATTNPNADIKVYVYEDFYLHSQVLMPHGSVLVGKIANISQPKPWMNAGFKFVPIYYMDSEKRKYKINMPLSAKYAAPSEIDKDAMVDSARDFGIGRFIPGAKFIKNAFNGARQRQGGVIKGAAKNIYKHTFWAKGEMGAHIRIKKYDCFYLIFPIYDKDKYPFEQLFTQIDNYGNPLVEQKNGTIVPKKDDVVEGSDLQVNYPTEHQIKDKIFYLSRPKKPKKVKDDLVKDIKKSF